MSRRRSLAPAIALAAALLVGVIAGDVTGADAQPDGTYTVTACSPSTSSGGWQAINNAPSSMTAGNLCGPGTPAIGPNEQLTETGALFGEDQIGSTTPVPTGDLAGWQFTAPAGTTITGVSYYASYETDGGGWLAGLMIDGTPVASDCQTNLDHTSPCQVLNNQLAQVQSGLDASSLFFGAACEQVEGRTRCAPRADESHNVEADLYSAQVTVSESASPLVQGESGPVWSTGVIWGTVPLSFNASDPSGIETVEIQPPAGRDLADIQEPCDFSQAQPCPQLPDGLVQLNTLGLPDGPEHVALKLTNAAGNTTVVQGPTFIVDNNGPPAPSSLTAAAQAKAPT